jgi:hypothetical protein
MVAAAAGAATAASPDATRDVLETTLSYDLHSQRPADLSAGQRGGEEAGVTIRPAPVLAWFPQLLLPGLYCRHA